MSWNYNFEPTLRDGLFYHYNEQVGILEDEEGNLFITDADGNKTPATTEELAAAEVKLSELMSEYQAGQYSHQRASAYPQISDQLDMLWHAIDSGTLDQTSEFYTTLAAVKDANPKPTE